MAERTQFMTFMTPARDVPEVPWTEWLAMAIRELKMTPDSFWSMPFPIAQRVLCGEPEQDITRKELLEGEREFKRRFADG